MSIKTLKHPHLLMLSGVFFAFMMDLFLKLGNSLGFLNEVIFIQCSFSFFCLFSTKNIILFINSKHITMHIFRSIFGWLFFISLLWSLQNLNLTTVCLIQAFSPIVIFFISNIMLKEKINLKFLVLLIISFFGVVVILIPSLNTFRIIETFIPLVGVLFFSLMRVTTKKISEEESASTLSLSLFFICACLSACFIKKENLLNINFLHYIFIFIAALFGIISQLKINEALQKEFLSKLTIYEYITIIIAPITDYIFWSINFSIYTIIGAFCIILPSLIINGVFSNYYKFN